MERLGVRCVVDTLKVLRDDGVWRMQPEDLGAPRKPSNFKQEGEPSAGPTGWTCLPVALRPAARFSVHQTHPRPRPRP